MQLKLEKSQYITNYMHVNRVTIKKYKYEKLKKNCLEYDIYFFISLHPYEIGVLHNTFSLLSPYSHHTLTILSQYSQHTLTILSPYSHHTLKK
jgi:hypothetical protein